jgi:hypothetical protein
MKIRHLIVLTPAFPRLFPGLFRYHEAPLNALGFISGGSLIIAAVLTGEAFIEKTEKISAREILRI